MTDGYKAGLAILFMAFALVIGMLAATWGAVTTSLVFQPLFGLACAISALFLPDRAIVGGLVMLVLTIVASLVGVVWYDALWGPLHPTRRFEILSGITAISFALLLFSTGRMIARWRRNKSTRLL